VPAARLVPPVRLNRAAWPAVCPPRGSFRPFA
jgi:hypothetical protein